jgi:PAS domain S-box-containing protein
MLMLAVAFWSLAYTFQLASAPLPAKIFWGKVKYFGIVLVPAAWLVFTLQYTGRERWVTTHLLALLALVPLGTLVLVWTNDSHGLFYQDITLGTLSSFAVRIVTHGVGFWLHTAYSYLLTLAGAALLIHALTYTPALYRGQHRALLVAALSPLAGNVLYLAHLNPFPHLDLTPFAFLITGLAVQWSICRYKMLDIVPIARYAVLENMPDGVIVVDLQQRIVDLNPAAQQMLGRTVTAAIGQPARRVFADWSTQAEHCLERMEAEIEIARIEGETLHYYALHLSPLQARTGRNRGTLVVLRDITAHKQAEEALRQARDELEQRVQERTAALRESEEKYRALVENIHEVIYTLDADGRLTYISPVVEQVSHYTVGELLDRPFTEFVHPEDLADVLASYQRTLAGQYEPYEFRVLDKDGTIRHVCTSSRLRLVDGQPVGLNAIMTDITERKTLEKERLKIEKLESLGVLAGGIAHDFNNILSVIMGNVSLAKLDVPTGKRLHGLLAEAEKAVWRAQTLTQQLLTFSKGGEPVKKPASLVEVMQESARFALRGSKARCDFILPDDLWSAEIDVGQISQVFHNVMINADHAMPEGGVIKVRAENLQLDNSSGLPVRPGRYLKITIQDQGIGIPEAHLAKIFDPYFSTKQHGSGLGLATAYSIIQRHEGHIAVESRLGVGTTLSLYLPASDLAPSQTAEEESQPIVGQGSILVMDDEEMIRMLATQMLTRLGYTAEVAKDGAEAIALYQRALARGSPFDAVILDLTVPGGMGGQETIMALLDIDPNVRALVSSGYSHDPILANYQQHGFRAVVAKPYDVAELSQILHAVITGKGDEPTGSDDGVLHHLPESDDTR